MHSEAMRQAMSRRRFLATAGVGAAGLLVACQRQSVGTTQASASHAPIEQELGALRAYEWAGYDVPPLFRDYLEAGNEKPTFAFFTSSEQALAKSAAGANWDTVHPEAGYVKDFVELGLVQ